LLLSL